MSNDNLWEGEENFEDKPEAAQTGKDGLPVSPTPMPEIHQYAPPVIPPSSSQPLPIGQEEYEAIDQTEPDEDEDYADILSDANLRLEQGSLYKLIMKHDLFEGSDADPKAIQNVQKAIRKFAKEQMEIMLGMRQDPETAVVERLEIDFPFNAMEVEFLKMVVHTGTKGASEHSDKYVPSVTRTTEEVEVVPRRNTLNPISSAPKKKMPKALASRPSAPVKRSKLDSVIEQVVRETGVPRELLEENQLLTKPVSKLTAEELIERNRLVAQRRGTQVKSSQAAPMPSPEQAAAMVERSFDNTGAKPNKLVELAMKMPPSKLLNPGE